MFDDLVLEEYIHTVYGYGNYGGKYWFVGMEEGGGGTFEEVDKRLWGWAKEGKKETTDLTGGYDYRTASSDTPVPKHFAERPKWQRTWGMLIRIMLSADNLPVSQEAIKRYQRDNLGRPGSDNCLVELLPLPSPSMGRWLYAKHTSLDKLQTRELYKQHYAPQRVKAIRERIEKHEPPVVIFYGLGYRHWWDEIAGVDFTEISAGSGIFYIGRSANTLFVITKHPAAKGITNDYFHQVGRDVALRLQESR